MATSPDPRLDIARKALPPPLLRALLHVFDQGIQGCWLAGGTALAGFYAGHRRSDDLDFFTASEAEQRATVLAIKSLENIGASVQSNTNTQQYFEGLGDLEGHSFKITAVLDPNLFRIGESRTPEGTRARIVDLDTLFKMKSATLVSRCGEKDLYDLIWLFEHFSERTFADVIALGNEIDGGVDGEAILACARGAILRQEACDFSLDPSIGPADIYKDITRFRDDLVRDLYDHLRDGSKPSPLGPLVKKIKSLKRG